MTYGTFRFHARIAHGIQQAVILQRKLHYAYTYLPEVEATDALPPA
jgi:hypothetical protein